MNQIRTQQERFGHLELKIKAYLGSKLSFGICIPRAMRLESGRENTEIHEGASNCSDPWGGRDG
jgi:hypothetical protein